MEKANMRGMKNGKIHKIKEGLNGIKEDKWN
jgi:hypothetical protein